MASPESTERLASFQTRFVVLCGMLSRLNGSSRHASPCLGDMHMADCRHLPCSQRRCANMRGKPPQTARSSLGISQVYEWDLLRSGSKLQYLTPNPSGVSVGKFDGCSQHIHHVQTTLYRTVYLLVLSALASRRHLVSYSSLPRNWKLPWSAVRLYYVTA